MKEKISSLAKKIESIKSKVASEEGTKQSMVLPLLGILGYDVSNPDDVMPEVSCDITKAKGERIDYVIFKDGRQAILLECKKWDSSLDNNSHQLRRYFVASDAKFAILTNGLTYQFFADHDKENIMDEKPFHTLDIRKLSNEDIDLLTSFCKAAFSTEKLISKSRDMRYRTVIMERLQKELANPSKGMVRLLSSGLYNGKLYDSIYNKFSWIIKDCIGLLVSDDASCLIKDIEKCEKVDKSGNKYTDSEQKIIEIVTSWLKEYETDKFKIYVRKLSNGYIRFCYSTEWWNICRIKVRWDKKLDVLICKEALAAKSVKIEVPNLESLPTLKHEIQQQCVDTKERLIRYRENHNCN